MIADWTPMRWPAVWKSASAVELLKGTAINCVIVEPGPVAEQAAQAGFKVCSPGSAPDGVHILEGIWPGIKIARFGARDAVSAGPTGEPWVDSNAWPVRLARARYPGTSIWIRATPATDQGDKAGGARAYTAALADAAIPGGRWIISLDDALAIALADRNPAALDTWAKITAAASFFATRRAWTDHVPEAVPGILSDFGTARTLELLNLITRSGQQYRVIPKDKLNSATLTGLRAIIYPDPGPLDTGGRVEVLKFVNAGGMLITGPEWSPAPGAQPMDSGHPRFSLFSLGKGLIAIANNGLTDPYQLASDSAILISHRHDLLRFWNGGALSAYYASAPDGKTAVAQILFYANRPTEDATVWLAGNYRGVRISTFDGTGAEVAHIEPRNGGSEIHLPRIAQYAALELET